MPKLKPCAGPRKSCTIAKCAVLWFSSQPFHTLEALGTRWSFHLKLVCVRTSRTSIPFGGNPIQFGGIQVVNQCQCRFHVDWKALVNEVPTPVDQPPSRFLTNTSRVSVLWIACKGRREDPGRVSSALAAQACISLSAGSAVLRFLRPGHPIHLLSAVLAPSCDISSYVGLPRLTYSSSVLSNIAPSRLLTSLLPSSHFV